NVAIGDGVPFNPMLPTLPASSFTMANDVGIGTANISLGQFFGNVTVGTDLTTNRVSAGVLSLTVGDNADQVRVNTTITGSESLTVGNVAPMPLTPPAVIVNGTVGTPGNPQSLTVQVGNGWPLNVGATVSGDERINPVTASNGDIVTVTSPSVGGDLVIRTGDNTPSLALTGNT